MSKKPRGRPPKKIEQSDVAPEGVVRALMGSPKIVTPTKKENGSAG